MGKQLQTADHDTLIAELTTFQRRKKELMREAKGKFVLIKGQEIADVLPTREAALNRGYALFGNQPFLVKEIVTTEKPVEIVAFNIGL